MQLIDSEQTKEIKMAKKVRDTSSILDFIMDEMGDKSISIMTSNSDSLVPWKVPFKHKGLQKITGGLLGGKIMEIRGDSQSGKSFLLYELIAGAIEMGGYSFLVDSEQAYEPAYGEKVGIGSKGFLYSNQIIIEDIFAKYVDFIKAVRSKVKDQDIPIVLGLDSFVATRSREQSIADEKNKEVGYGAMKKNNMFYDKLTMIQPILNEYGASLVIINQLRKDHTIMYGDNNKSPGENIKYFATQRLQGVLGKKIKKEIKATEEKVQTGMTTKWTVIKNRFVEPFKFTDVKILFRKGLLPYSGLGELLLNEEEIESGTKSIAKADGSEGKRQVKGYRIKGTDKFYSEEEIEKMIEEHAFLLEPKYTGKVDDSDFVEVEEELTDLSDLQ